MSELQSPQDTLSAKLRDRESMPAVWVQPDEFDLSSRVDRREVERQIDLNEITHVVDRLPQFADDIFELRHPGLKSDDRARQEFVKDIVQQGDEYGHWFQFRWNKSLVRFPLQEEHRELRTFRNKDLVTDEEQKKLLGTKAAVYGLSVGSNVVDQLVQGGIGGTVIMGDFDTLSPTNLNRIRAGVPQVGMKKIDIAATKISEIDPYITQIHHREGVNAAVLEQLAAEKPDVIFDEIDDLAMKAMLRNFAAKNHVPLIMATDVGDTSIIDVERYDLDAETKAFHGKIKQDDIERLISGDMPDEVRQKLMIKIVGAKHISPRLLQSAMQVDKTLGGLPQLGATAAEGGSLASVAARELILGRKLETGRYISSMRKTLNLQHVTPLREGLETLVQFIRASK